MTQQGQDEVTKFSLNAERDELKSSEVTKSELSLRHEWMEMALAAAYAHQSGDVFTSGDIYQELQERNEIKKKREDYLGYITDALVVQSLAPPPVRWLTVEGKETNNAKIWQRVGRIMGRRQ